MAAGVEKHGDELYCPTCEQTYPRGERCPKDNTRLVRIAATRDQLIGRELDGRYTIIEQLGAGGMGAVYRGTQHQLGREVAIKVVTPSLVKEPLVIKRFLREAKLASKLSHPNAVSVLDFGQTEDGLFFLVLELVNGRTLEDIVLQDGRMTPARVVRIGTQICDALEGAHALQIIHRDLKPQNVMVMATGRDLVKVLDFGLAKSLSPEQGKTTMTNAGALLGTPAFMPPELVSGHECDARSDLYSLGCVLYMCAAGKLPFASSSVHEVIAAHASDPPPRIKDIPLRLWSIIEKLLEKEPSARYQGAAETREALEAALSERADTEDSDQHATQQSTMLGWDGSSGVRTSPGKRGAFQTPVPGMRQTPVPRQRVATPLGVPRMKTPPSVPREDVAALATLPSEAMPAPAPRPTAQVAARPRAPAKSFGWKPIALVLAAAIAAAAVAFLVVDGSSKKKSKGKVESAPVVEPKAEPVKAATPAVEPPKVEPPRVEPAVEPPKVEPTKIETPKVEPPKLETKQPPVTKAPVTKAPVTRAPLTKPPTKPPVKEDPVPPRRPVKTNPGVM